MITAIVLVDSSGVNSGNEYCSPSSGLPSKCLQSLMPSLVGFSWSENWNIWLLEIPACLAASMAFLIKAGCARSIEASVFLI